MLNKNLSQPLISTFCLVNNFIASAQVCKSPHIPTLFGPFLCVNKANIFLSIKTKISTTKIIAAAIIQNGSIGNVISPNISGILCLVKISIYQKYK